MTKSEIKSNIVNCSTCRFHDDFTWVCFNPDSPRRADITDKFDSCSEWGVNAEAFIRAMNKHKEEKDKKKQLQTQ